MSVVKSRRGKSIHSNLENFNKLRKNVIVIENNVSKRRRKYVNYTSTYDTLILLQFSSIKIDEEITKARYKNQDIIKKESIESIKLIRNLARIVTTHLLVANSISDTFIEETERIMNDMIDELSKLSCNKDDMYLARKTFLINKRKCSKLELTSKLCELQDVVIKAISNLPKSLHEKYTIPAMSPLSNCIIFCYYQNQIRCKTVDDYKYRLKFLNDANIYLSQFDTNMNILLTSCMVEKKYLSSILNDYEQSLKLLNGMIKHVNSKIKEIE